MARSQVAQLVVLAFDVIEFHISNHSADASFAGIENFRPAGDFLDVVGSDRRGCLQQGSRFAVTRHFCNGPFDRFDFGSVDNTIAVMIGTFEPRGIGCLFASDFAVPICVG